MANPFPFNPDTVRRTRGRIYAFDVGASNSRDGEFEAGELCREVSRWDTCPDEDTDPYAVLEERFIDGVERCRPDVVMFGVAGPPTPQGVKFTNTPVHFEIELARLRRIARKISPKTSVFIVNDGVAGAAGFRMLPPDSVFQFNGQAIDFAKQRRYVLAILGTGAAVVLIDGNRIFPSEMGHFFNRPSTDSDLSRWLNNKYGSAVELEATASALGIVNIYKALLAAEGKPARNPILKTVAKHEWARIIAEASQKKGADPLFIKTMELFREALAYAVSSWMMLLQPVVLAGSPVVHNFDYLFQPQDRNDDEPVISQFIRNRSVHSGLVADSPALALRPDQGAESEDLVLFGAGAFGTTKVRPARG